VRILLFTFTAPLDDRHSAIKNNILFSESNAKGNRDAAIETNHTQFAVTRHCDLKTLYYGTLQTSFSLEHKINCNNGWYLVHRWALNN